MNKDKDVDLELLRSYAYGIKTPLHKGWTSRYMAQILLNIDSVYIPEAETWIRKAIEADRRNGMMFHLGKSYVLYAELFRRRRDKTKAKEELNVAIDIFKERGSDGWVEKYRKELAELE